MLLRRGALNESKVGSVTTSSVIEFQVPTTRNLNTLLLSSVLALSLNSLKLCPLIRGYVAGPHSAVGRVPDL